MLKRLIEPNIETFTGWLISLHKEDIAEFGSVIERSANDLNDLYAIYLNFHTKDKSND